MSHFKDSYSFSFQILFQNLPITWVASKFVMNSLPTNHEIEGKLKTVLQTFLSINSNNDKFSIEDP